MLFRFYLSPFGRIGAYQYRHFLLQFWLAFLPISIFIFLGLVWIGVRYPEGVMRQMTLLDVEALTVIYVLMCTWPLVACTLRRLHDLDLAVGDVIWLVDPRKTRELGKRMFYERGSIGPNRFGLDPEEEA